MRSVSACLFTCPLCFGHHCTHKTKLALKFLRILLSPFPISQWKHWGYRHRLLYPSPMIVGIETLVQQFRMNTYTVLSPQPPPILPSTPTHWDESTLGIFAATQSSEHTLVILQHIARLTDAALLASGGDFGTGSLTEAIRVQAGR